MGYFVFVEWKLGISVCICEFVFFLKCPQGVLRSRGNVILFADADGATRFADVEKLEIELMKLKTSSKVYNICRGQ